MVNICTNGRGFCVYIRDNGSTRWTGRAGPRGSWFVDLGEYVKVSGADVIGLGG